MKIVCVPSLRHLRHKNRIFPQNKTLISKSTFVFSPLEHCNTRCRVWFWLKFGLTNLKRNEWEFDICRELLTCVALGATRRGRSWCCQGHLAVWCWTNALPTWRRGRCVRNGRAFFSFCVFAGVVESKSLSEAVALSQSVESGRGRTLVRPFFPFQSLSLFSVLSLFLSCIFSLHFFWFIFPFNLSNLPTLVFSYVFPPFFSLEEKNPQHNRKHLVSWNKFACCYVHPPPCFSFTPLVVDSHRTIYIYTSSNRRKKLYTQPQKLFLPVRFSVEKKIVQRIFWFVSATYKLLFLFSSTQLFTQHQCKFLRW